MVLSMTGTSSALLARGGLDVGHRHLVVGKIEIEGDAKRAQVAHAFRGVGLCLGDAEQRDRDSREQSDDADGDENFDEREAAFHRRPWVARWSSSITGAKSSFTSALAS